MYKNLEVYQKAFGLAMYIFEIAKTFPKEERFAFICNYITKELKMELLKEAEEI